MWVVKIQISLFLSPESCSGCLLPWNNNWSPCDSCEISCPQLLCHSSSHVGSLLCLWQLMLPTKGPSHSCSLCLNGSFPRDQKGSSPCFYRCLFRCHLTKDVIKFEISPLCSFMFLPGIGAISKLFIFWLPTPYKDLYLFITKSLAWNSASHREGSQ